MNKRELAKAVAVQSDVDLKTVSNVLEGFTDVVTAVVSKGEPVAISGFAKFVKVDRRPGRIRSRQRVTFRGRLRRGCIDRG